MSEGKLIVIEGLDKAGKETQSSLLAQYLSEKDNVKGVWVKGFPDYDSDTGELIKDYLNGKQFLSQKTINMIYSANRYCHKKYIEEIVYGRGEILILDRYYFSNMAYGANGGESIHSIECMDLEMPKPDLVIFIDIHPLVAMKRGNKSLDENERNIDLLTKARERYYFMANQMYHNWVIVNGDSDKQEVHEQIVALVEDRLFK